MSETTGPHTGNYQGSHRLGTVGPTIDGFKTKILDPDPEGNGEIWYETLKLFSNMEQVNLTSINIGLLVSSSCSFNSRNVMMGYLNKPKDTRDAIDNYGWLHSGDIGFEQDGFITVNKRMSNNLRDVKLKSCFM